MQRPRLTFIHGFMGHPSDWGDVRSMLPEFETNALEMPVAADWQASINQVADGISDSAIVIGYSMGARLALGVALENPQRCAGLVFVSGNPGLEHVEARERRWKADQKIAQELEQLTPESLQPFLERWYQVDVFATTPQDIRHAEIVRKCERFSPEWAKILRANSVSQQPNYWPRLSELSMPTAVVAGELDEKYREIVVRFDQEHGSGNVSKTIVSDCGHIVHRQQPETLVQTIRDLVETVAKR